VVDEGKDLDNFLWEAIKYVKDILIYKTTGEIDLYTEDEKKEISKLCDIVTKERLFELIYKLSELANTIKWSSSKTIMLQVGLMKCCEMPALKPDVVEGSHARTGGKHVDAAKKEPPVSVADSPLVKGAKVQEVSSKPIEDSSYAPYWNKILDTLKTKGRIMLYTNLMGTKAKKANDLIVEIEFPGKITAFAKTVLEQHDNKEEISKMVSAEEGQNMQIKYIENAGASIHTPPTEKPKKNIIPDDIGIEINIIDA